MAEELQEKKYERGKERHVVIGKRCISTVTCSRGPDVSIGLRSRYGPRRCWAKVEIPSAPVSTRVAADEDGGGVGEQHEEDAAHHRRRPIQLCPLAPWPAGCVCSSSAGSAVISSLASLSSSSSAATGHHLSPSYGISLGRGEREERRRGRYFAAREV
jgi:hypothetical protein